MGALSSCHQNMELVKGLVNWESTEWMLDGMVMVVDAGKVVVMS